MRLAAALLLWPAIALSQPLNLEFGGADPKAFGAL